MAVRKAAEREGVLHPVSFRATTDLREKLAKAASEAGRSLTQEIERRLERSFDHEKMASEYITTLVENAQLQAQNIEIQAELADLKSAGPDTADLEAIVERAVARVLKQVLSLKGGESEQPQPDIVMSDIELSERQRNILDFLIKGAPNREIAQKLGIAHEALKAEIGTILKKISALNRVEAIILAKLHVKPADFEHEARQYQTKPKTARKAPAQAKSKA